MNYDSFSKLIIQLILVSILIGTLMNNEVIAQFPEIEKLLERLESFKKTPLGEGKESNDVETPGHGWEGLGTEFNHCRSAIVQLFVYYGDVIKGGTLPDGLTGNDGESYGATLARKYVDTGFRVFYESLEQVTPILLEAIGVCQRLYKDPDPGPVAAKLFHSLLKAEGVHVIEAIRQAVRISQIEYNAYEATIPNPNAKVDKFAGRNLEAYYRNSGIHWRVISLAEALKNPLQSQEAVGFEEYLQRLHWDESFTQNKSNLNRIIENLQKLLDQLSD